MIATVIGFALLAIGGAGILAVARKWGANLAEIHLLATAAVFGGYALVPMGSGADAIRIAALVLFVISGGSSIQKIRYFRDPSGTLGFGLVALPYLVALALSAGGIWFVLN